MKKLCSFVLFLSMVVCMLPSFRLILSDSKAGFERSMGGIVTEETKKFYLEKFGSAETPEDLTDALLAFALENFVYDDSVVSRPQIADNHRFIFKNCFHGVCMDFSAFVKSAVQVVSDEKGWDHVGCVVVLGYDSVFSEGHATNYIVIENPDGTAKIFVLDTTWEVDRNKKGLPLQGLNFYYPVTKEENRKEKINALFDSYYQYRVSVVV